MPEHHALTLHQIQTLQANGCTAEDWKMVLARDGFDPRKVRHVRFGGTVKLGAMDGEAPIPGAGGPGIYNAHLMNCTVGDNSRIANIGRYIASYDIAPGSCIENVGTMECRPGATFGNGVEVESLNEGGGREVILFNELSAQFAHLLCLHRHRPKLIQTLRSMALAAAAKVKSDRGTIGPGARVVNVAEMIDVNVGPRSVVNGAASLMNGTILGAEDAPATVGAGVVARDFIIGEASVVDGAAILTKTFVGQGCRVGKQFSAENCLFFANCEAFHGEAVSVFAGPYTVTHHKSTLLIAGLFSFYNAGSGTNQSNHMYKLGPVHEGKLERGCKTGSFSYMIWPCRVGPFSVVLGKHGRAFDTGDLPFSFLEPDASGRTTVLPGLNLSTVGTVRDGAKWPARDRRKGALKRDRINFEVLSPLTVGRMLRASEKLQQLHETTGKEVETVGWNGALIKRVLLRTALKFYRHGIEVYLLDKAVARLEAALEAHRSPAAAFVAVPDAAASDSWVDLGGQLMAQQRLQELTEALESGKIAEVGALEAALHAIAARYEDDEWAWVKKAYAQVFRRELDGSSIADLAVMLDQWLAAKDKFLKLILVDAGKEFDEIARTGFALDVGAEAAAADFRAVRGEYDSHSFVEQIQREIAQLPRRAQRLKAKLVQE